LIPLLYLKNTGEPARFGVKDFTDLTWKNRRKLTPVPSVAGAPLYARPIITGQAAIPPPRKIMMDTRDRITEVGITWINMVRI